MFLSFVSLFDNCRLMLLFIPLNILFITLNIDSAFFLFEYFFCLKVFFLFNRWCPFVRVFNDIWFSAFDSLFMHFLIGSVLYALFAKMYFGLYFFIFLIATIAKCVSNLGSLWAAKWIINLNYTSIEIWFFT